MGKDCETKNGYLELLQGAKRHHEMVGFVL